MLVRICIPQWSLLKQIKTSGMWECSYVRFPVADQRCRRGWTTDILRIVGLVYYVCVSWKVSKVIWYHVGMLCGSTQTEMNSSVANYICVASTNCFFLSLWNTKTTTECHFRATTENANLTIAITAINLWHSSDGSIVHPTAILSEVSCYTTNRWAASLCYGAGRKGA